MASTSRGSSNSAGGAGSESEGEDQDEPSSSDLLGTREALEKLTMGHDEKSKIEDGELSSFREQWRRELDVASPARIAASPARGVQNNVYKEWVNFGQQPQPELQGTPPLEECVGSIPKSESPVDELSAFRQQWQRELEATPEPQPTEPKRTGQPTVTDATDPQTAEELAKQLFLRGVDFERGGKLYEAIQHYKRAMQILPDVESRLYDCPELRPDSPEVESFVEESGRTDSLHPSDDEDAVEGEDLMARFSRILARRGQLLEMEMPQKGAHISWLPYEVILLILRWVVSAELDAVSLERASGVCRGLYVAAKQPDLWRALCVRTWGIECGGLRGSGFDSWRDMYVQRPRLFFHGCYISKTTYLRHGENAYQDASYRPWYLIDYFRYLRFFPEGVVLMWTTPDEPAQCVAHLRNRAAKPGAGILAGHYRLVGTKVVVVVKKSSGEKGGGHTRFRARRKDAHDAHDQTFHLELELHNTRRRRNSQLWWARYAVACRGQWSTFELSPGKYPPFAFSAVRHYAAEARAPLPPAHSLA